MNLLFLAGVTTIIEGQGTLAGAEDLSEAIVDGVDNSELDGDAVEEEIAGILEDEITADLEEGKFLLLLTHL